MDLASLDAILAFAGLLEECSGSTSSTSGGSSSTTGEAHNAAAAAAPPPPLPSDLAALLPAAHARDTFRRRVRGALELIGSILDLFPLESLALTFNGGKDACVVFYLVRAAVAAAVRRRQPPEPTGEEETAAAVAAALRRVAVLYFAPRHGEEFPEVAAFMEEVASGRARVGVGASGGSDGDDEVIGDRGDLGGFEYTVYQVGYQDGMRDMVDNRGLKAVFMGVRSGDPYSLESEHVQPSSAGWPPFLRVNAILKWDYGHVWTFLQGFRLPYCCLYDHGYTSIGDVRTTVPNPALLRPEAIRPSHNDVGDDSSNHDADLLPTDPDMYRPAHELEDYTLERANRVPYPTGAGKSPKAPSPPPPPPLPSLPSPTVSAEVGGLEDGDDDDAASAKSDATAAATAVAEGRRKRGSFCDQLRAAVVCIGDFLSQRDSAPMALAHELRELRCLVAPLAIVPPQPLMVRAQLAHVLRETCTASPPPAVVFVLGIDEDAWSLAREVIGGLAPTPLTDDEGTTGDDAGEADAGADGAGWRAATAHVASCGRVFLLAPAFACKSGDCALSLEAQRNELDSLLDAIAGGIPSMSVRHGSTLSRASPLPPDPVVVAARKGL